MDKTYRLSLWCLLALSMASLVLGFIAFQREASANTVGSGSLRLPQFLQIASQDLALPLSVQGRRVLLDSCELVLQESAPLILRFASESQREHLLPFCRSISEGSVAASPVDSYAWLILATVQLRQGDRKAAEQSIVWSALTGANESWIAEVRFDLIQSSYEQFSPRIQAIADADTAALVPSNRGWVVAREYVTNADFRERAEAIIEAQPEIVQRRFLSLIRRQI